MTRPLGVLDPAPPQGCSCVGSLSDSAKFFKILQILGALRVVPPCGVFVATWTNLALSWSNLAVLSAMFVHLVQLVSYLASTWTIFAPTWLNLAPTWPNLLPSWPNFGPTWSILVPTWSNMVPKSDQDELQELFSGDSKRCSVLS